MFSPSRKEGGVKRGRGEEGGDSRGKSARSSSSEQPASAHDGEEEEDETTLEDLEAMQGGAGAGVEEMQDKVHGFEGHPGESTAMHAVVRTQDLSRLLKTAYKFRKENIITVHGKQRGIVSAGGLTVEALSDDQTMMAKLDIPATVRMRLPNGSKEILVAPSTQEMSTLVSCCPADSQHRTTLYTLPDQPERLFMTMAGDGSLANFSSELAMQACESDSIPLDVEFSINIALDPATIVPLMAASNGEKVDLLVCSTHRDIRRPGCHTAVAFMAELLSGTVGCVAVDIKPSVEGGGDADPTQSDDAGNVMHLDPVDGDEVAAQNYTPQMLKRMHRLYKASFGRHGLHKVFSSAGRKMSIMLTAEAVENGPMCVEFGSDDSLSGRVIIMPREEDDEERRAPSQAAHRASSS